LRSYHRFNHLQPIWSLQGKKEYPDPGCLASVAQHSATVTSDLEFFFCGDNLDLVCGKAKELETIGGYGSNVTAVLSDAASEDEQINTIEEG